MGGKLTRYLNKKKVISYWQKQALKTVEKVARESGNRQIVSAEPTLGADYCFGGYPCRGHDGMKLVFVDGEVQHISCDSVSIGAVQYYVYGDKVTHFSPLVDKLKKKIKRMF